MKDQFMKQLAMYLEPLNEEEREEILSFYEERFYTGKLYEGKSEAEIVAELEDPEDIARNVLREYGKPFVPQSHRPEGEGIKVGSLIGVILFDMFFVSWFVPALFAIMSGFAAGLASLLVTLVMVPFSAAEGSLATMLVGLGLLFFGVLLVLWLYDILVTFIAWLLKWHLQALNLQTKDWVRRIRNLRVSNFLKKRPRTNKLKNQLKFVALLLVIVGGFYQIVNFNTLQFNLGAQELITDSVEEPVTDVEGWDVNGELGTGDLVFYTHEQDTIRIETRVAENADMEVSIDEATKTITLTQDINYFSFNIGQWVHSFTNEPTIDVYLPEDLSLESVNIDHMNGDIVLDDHTVGELDLFTINGDVRLDSVASDAPMHLGTTNGNVIGQSLSSSELDANSTNGRVDIRNGTFDTLDASTTNGKIIVQDINDASTPGSKLQTETTNGNIELVNVYMDRVTMKSTNGSLSYDNDDDTFIIDRLSYTTTNGRTDISVPHTRD
ncbi:MAG: DUF4097 family beta strand repeat-containing protein [Bacillota bacterium]